MITFAGGNTGLHQCSWLCVFAITLDILQYMKQSGHTPVTCQSV